MRSKPPLCFTQREVRQPRAAAGSAGAQRDGEHRIGGEAVAVDEACVEEVQAAGHVDRRGRPTDRSMTSKFGLCAEN